MRVKFFVSLAAALACLLLGSLLFAETARPPQQERQKFMPEGVVEHKAGSATVAANDPRPLAQAVSAMREEYGWLVDYEDPPYMSDAELVDDTDPQWRASHPNAPGVRRVAGGAFKSEYQESAGETTRGGQEAVLRKIVSEYNRSGNPGKFTVRLEEEGRFAVVGLSIKNQAGQDQNVTPVLDTLISVPAKQLSAGESIGAILKELSSKSGTKVVLGTVPTNLLAQSQVTVGGEKLPARALLLQTLDATKRPLVWRLLYDADSQAYFLNIRIATRTMLDTFGRKTSLPIDDPSARRQN